MAISAQHQSIVTDQKRMLFIGTIAPSCPTAPPH